MTLRSPAALLAALSLSCHSASSGVDCPLIANATLSVTVLDADTGRSVCGVTIVVSAITDGGDDAGPCPTFHGGDAGAGAMGTCESSLGCNAPVGSYEVHVQAPGYMDADERLDVVSQECSATGSIVVRLKKQ